jgi:hypothetical protein
MEAAEQAKKEREGFLNLPTVLRNSPSYVIVWSTIFFRIKSDKGL